MNISSKFKVGLVGAGYISEYHIKALKRLSDVDLLGVYDIDKKQAESVSERLQVNVYPSVEAFKENGADSIHVLTPPHTHADITLQALRMGCHVLVEKPLVVDVNDCDKIKALAEEKNLKVCVNHSLLFDPQVKRALHAVRQGKLGRVISVDILRSSVYPPYPGGPLPPQYREGGYPFRDLGIHALYLFQAFLGEIEHVEASWQSFGGDPNLGFDEWRALVQCKNGLGQFQLSWNVNPLQSQIIIQGTRGVLRADLFLMYNALRGSLPLPKPVERIVNAMTDSFQPLIDVPLNVIRFAAGRIRPYHGLQDLVAEFYRSLRENKPVPQTVSDAIPVVKWTEAIARKADKEHTERVQRYKLSEQVPILVTGASGALGSALVDRLCAEGKRFRMFVRRPPVEVPQGAEVALGDLGDPEAVDRAVRGAEIVVHAGAAMKGGWVEHQCGTVTGTRNVLEACRKYHVKRLVHISSLSVVDWAGSHKGDPISEKTELEPRAQDRGAYTRAKLEAEVLVSKYCEDYHLPAVILRPGQIFGKRIPLLTPAVARRMGKRWLILGDGTLLLPLVYIEDVIDAILLASESNLKDGEIIHLVDDKLMTQNQLLNSTVGEKAKVHRVPRTLLFLAGGLSQVLLGILGRKSPLSIYRLHSALPRLRFQSNKAKTLLNWSPRVGVSQGIERELAQGSEDQA